MLRSSEQACNPLDASYFNEVQAIGILTLESQFRLKTLGIYLTQNAFVCPCGTQSVLIILCYYCTLMNFPYFLTHFSIFKSP